MPIAIFVRFLLLAPIALVWPPLHRWLEVHASSFAMNPEYRRAVGPEMAAKMRRWEIATLACMGRGVCDDVCGSAAVSHVRPYGWAVLTIISLLNTVRVLGAHEYDSEGAFSAGTAS